MSRKTSLYCSLAILALHAGCADSNPDDTELDEEIGEAESEVSNGTRWVEILGSGEDTLSIPTVATDGARNVLLSGTFTGTHEIGGTTVTSTEGIGGLVAKLDRNGEVQWVRQPIGTGDVHVNAVTADLLGNVYVVGVFNESVDWGHGPMVSAGDDDFFVAKLSKNGTLKWAKRFGGAGQDWSSAVAVDLYGGLAIGFSSTDELDLGDGPRSCASCGGEPLTWGGYAVLDVHGHHLFDGVLESDTDMAGPSVAFGYAGDLWVASTFEGTAFVDGQTFANAGVTDILLAHYDFYGQPLSATSYGGPGYDWETVVAARPDGGAVLTGSLGAGTTNFGGQDITVAPPFPDQFVLAVDADGAHDFSFAVGTDGADGPGGIAVDLFGNIAIAGALAGITDLGDGPIGTNGFFFSGFFAKYDSSGELIWSEAAKDVPSPNPFALAYSAFGGVAFDPWSGELIGAGTFTGAFDFAGTQSATTGGFGAENTVVARLRR